jgi:hypothetical protein
VVDGLALAGNGKTWAEPERKVDYDLHLRFDSGAEAGIQRHCIMPARNETYQESNSMWLELINFQGKRKCPIT